MIKNGKFCSVDKKYYGKLVENLDEMLNLAKEKKSVIWNGRRFPAAVAINWSFKMVVDNISKKKFYVYKVE